jgi:hypothetical protein
MRQSDLSIWERVVVWLLTRYWRAADHAQCVSTGENGGGASWRMTSIAC